MKRLQLNDKPIDVSIEEADTMHTIVSQITEWSKGINEYPIRLVIDDREYVLTESEWHNIAPADVDQVDIYTFSPAILREYLPQLDTISQLLQGNGRKQAMELVFKISTLLSYTISIVPFLHGVNSEKMQSQIKALTSDLNNLYQSIAQDDTILIGDLLEYEIRDKIEQLLTTINA